MKKLLFNIFVFFIRALPYKTAMFFGRFMGSLVYRFDVRHRRLVVSNIRQAFLKKMNHGRVKSVARQFYSHFVQNIIEIIRLPQISKKGYEHYVELVGQEHIQEAIAKGKGCIFLSMHSGNWELSNLVGSMQGVPYNMVANKLSKKKSVFESFLNQCRTTAGCKIIYPGLGGREIIRALKNNEIVTLVADQGGREGELVRFFNRCASMSTGAVRLALKYKAPIMLVDIMRLENGKHRLKVVPFELKCTGNIEIDVKRNLEQIIYWHEKCIVDHPCEYMWQYRIWKDTNKKFAIILNDGRIGHLRQSEAVLACLKKALSERNIDLNVKKIDIQFKNKVAEFLFKMRGFFPKFLLSAEKALNLKKALSDDCGDQLLNQIHADFVISCGSFSAAVNHLVGALYQAKTIGILKQGLLTVDSFDTVIMPEHDRPRYFYRHRYLYFTQVAPNMINQKYMDESILNLENHFSHLKKSVRTRIGVLIGGNTKGVVFTEHQAKIVAHQILEAAAELNAELLVTTSRRTPKSIIKIFHKEFKDSGKCALFIQPDKQDIPSAVGGILGLSEIVVVSGESISMVSEAVSSGKKVVVFPVGVVSRFKKMNKYQRFVHLLHENGYLVEAQSLHITEAILSYGKSKMPTRKLTDDYTLLRAMRIII